MIELANHNDIECDICGQTAVGHIYGTEVLCSYCCLEKAFDDKDMLRAFAEHGKNDEAYRRFVMTRMVKAE